MFRKQTTFILPVFVAFSLAACGGSDLPEVPEGAFANDALMTRLTNETGLDAAQAAGSLGVILNYARDHVPNKDYSAFHELLPGSDRYIAYAREAGLLGEPIGDADAFFDALGDIGVSGSEADAVISEVGEYLRTVSGRATQEAFSRLF